MNALTQDLQAACRRLLESGTVKAILGYGRIVPEDPAIPVFITRPGDTERLVFDGGCFTNLTTYLARKQVRGMGKIGIVLKGCDERSLVVLEQEGQIDRANLHVIGIACPGVDAPSDYKCASCTVRLPRFADEIIGEISVTPVPQDYADVEELLALPVGERLEHWKKELSRCIKCYACREVCPTCYCGKCITDKNRPQCIDTSATLKGNFAWQITRAFHQAGRCVDCGECSRVCPAGINLRPLNRALARAAEKNFGYQSGMDRETPPVVGSYSKTDEEKFIK